ncbi:hypothetical protein [Psychrobacter sp.]|uniref:hypothetical protein n=1 Tax=Psychrobacter sp. TaxID=56811 RepID=UPI0025DF063D|nr:hypothetical protein [Psychrobacter sp.]
MFDIKSLLTRSVEKQLIDVDDYIFIPERYDLEVDDGILSCVLNSDGRVDIFYQKHGITDVRSASRKHAYTGFDRELYLGIYDDVIDDLIKDVNKLLEGHSKFFKQERVLPATAALNAKPFTDSDHY